MKTTSFINTLLSFCIIGSTVAAQRDIPPIQVLLGIAIAAQIQNNGAVVPQKAKITQRAQQKNYNKPINNKASRDSFKKTRYKPSKR